MQYVINIGTFIDETDVGFTLVNHPLIYEPYYPTCVGSSVEIPSLEHEIVTPLFNLLLYIYDLWFMRLATCYDNRSIESIRSINITTFDPGVQILCCTFCGGNKITC